MEPECVAGCSDSREGSGRDRSNTWVLLTVHYEGTRIEDVNLLRYDQIFFSVKPSSGKWPDRMNGAEARHSHHKFGVTSSILRNTRHKKCGLFCLLFIVMLNR